jgi:hypothetical protein
MGPKSTFWGIYTVSIIAIWIKKFGVSMGHSDHVQKKIYIFFSKMTFASASADGRAKIMFGMTTTNGTFWHRNFHLIELN